MKKNRIICWIFLVITFACKFKIQDKVVPEWEAEILGPLVTANLTAQDLADIDPLHARKSISLSEIGVTSTGIPVVIPAIGPKKLGPYTLDLSDAFGEGEFISGEIYFTITNELEVGVKKDTRISIKDGGKLVLGDILDEDLAPNNGFYTSPPISVAGQTLSSSLTLELENFTTTSSGSKVAIDPKRRLIIDVYIRNVKFKKIKITTTDLFSIADTSEFSLEGEVIKSESVKGAINTYVTSSFPVQLLLQVYFMDESNTIKLDSLFNSPAVIQGLKNNVVSESKFITTIDNTKTQNLNKSRFVRSFVKMSTGNNIIIYDTTAIKVKMVGDLQVKVDQ